MSDMEKGMLRVLEEKEARIEKLEAELSEAVAVVRLLMNPTEDRIDSAHAFLQKHEARR